MFTDKIFIGLDLSFVGSIVSLLQACLALVAFVAVFIYINILVGVSGRYVIWKHRRLILLILLLSLTALDGDILQLIQA